MTRWVLYFLLCLLSFNKALKAEKTFNEKLQAFFMERSGENLKNKIDRFFEFKKKHDTQKFQKKEKQTRQTKEAKTLFQNMFEELFDRHKENQNQPTLLKEEDGEISKRSKKEFQQQLELYNNMYNEFFIPQDKKEEQEYAERFKVLEPIEEKENPTYEEELEYNRKYERFNLFLDRLNALLESFFEFFTSQEDPYQFIDISDVGNIFYSGTRYGLGLSEKGQSYFASLFAGEQSERMINFLEKQTIKNEIFLQLLWSSDGNVDVGHMFKLLREENDTLMLSITGKQLAESISGEGALSKQYLELSQYSGYRIDSLRNSKTLRLKL